MKVPLSWLREFVEVSDEPARLAEALTLAGLAVDAIETHGNDTVLDIDVTTNRVDCMNVYGVAREVSVLCARPLKPLDLAFSEKGRPAAEAIEVTIEAVDLCGRFALRVLDVRLGPSPAWMRDRLEMVGVRPISNVVDISNYVMLEMGHPSHAFDLDKLPHARLIARWCRPGEKITTLDGVERQLSGRIGLVAGPEEPLALAGIMGGGDSEVSDSTQAIALEAAYWEPLAIRRAAKALGMHTEASHRFERGADPEGPAIATARVAHLAEKIGAGTTRPGLIDRIGTPRLRRIATLRPRRPNAVLGVSVPEERVRGILQGLGFMAGSRGSEGTAFEIPSWRGDVTREIDLIEEVARHFGVNRIPTTIPPAERLEGLRPAQVREREVREVLVGFGLTEIINYAFVANAAARPDPTPRAALANPISQEQDVLRSSLVIPGLLGTLKSNLSHGRRDLRVFEVGRVFVAGDGAPREERRLGILLTGPARPLHWSEKRRAADAHDVAGILESLFQRLGVPELRIEREGIPAFLHPFRAAVLLGASGPLGYLGSIHPDLAAEWGFKDQVVVAEIGLDSLPVSLPPVRFRPTPRFPGTSRDLSLVCDEEVEAAGLEQRIKTVAGDALQSVLVADRYQGPPVPAGKVGLMVSLSYQSDERTLTGDEVQSSVDRVVGELRSAGIEIRGV